MEHICPFYDLTSSFLVLGGWGGSSNSPVRSWTLCGPVSAQSTLGSTPSSTGPAQCVSDWPEPPSAGAARGSPPAARPIWAARLLWRTGRSAPLHGCSTCSPGRPGSKGHCSFPETAPSTAEERTKRNEIVRECPRKNNSITDTFHYSLPSFLPAVPPSNLQFSFISSPFPPPPLCVPAQHPKAAAEHEHPWSPGAWAGGEQHKAARDTAWQQGGRQETTSTGDVTAAHTDDEFIPKIWRVLLA